MTGDSALGNQAAGWRARRPIRLDAHVPDAGLAVTWKSPGGTNPGGAGWLGIWGGAVLSATDSAASAAVLTGGVRTMPGLAAISNLGHFRLGHSVRRPRRRVRSWTPDAGRVWGALHGCQFAGSELPQSRPEIRPQAGPRPLRPPSWRAFRDDSQLRQSGGARWPI